MPIKNTLRTAQVSPDTPGFPLDVKLTYAANFATTVLIDVILKFLTAEIERRVNNRPTEIAFREAPSFNGHTYFPEETRG